MKLFGSRRWTRLKEESNKKRTAHMTEWHNYVFTIKTLETKYVFINDHIESDIIIDSLWVDDEKWFTRYRTWFSNEKQYVNHIVQPMLILEGDIVKRNTLSIEAFRERHKLPSALVVHPMKSITFNARFIPGLPTIHVFGMIGYKVKL